MTGLAHMQRTLTGARTKPWRSAPPAPQQERLPELLTALRPPIRRRPWPCEDCSISHPTSGAPDLRREHPPQYLDAADYLAPDSHLPDADPSQAAGPPRHRLPRTSPRPEAPSPEHSATGLQSDHALGALSRAVLLALDPIRGMTGRLLVPPCRQVVELWYGWGFAPRLRRRRHLLRPPGRLPGQRPPQDLFRALAWGGLGNRD